MTQNYLNSAGIAQLVEQRFCNPQAPRSNRGAGTINSNPRIIIVLRLIL